MTIPIHLQKEGIRFCRVANKSKRPFEKDWTNKPYTHEQILEHANHNGENYGVLGGHGGLIVIDCDEPELKEHVQKFLPKTFAVQTGSGGLHLYFICPEMKKKLILTTDKHYGEIQSWGTQVVGPGSVHPNGNTYDVIEDIAIQELSMERLIEGIKDFMPQFKEAEKTTQELKDFGDSDINNIRITDVLSTGQFKRGTNNELFGPNPWHGSDTGMNFWINPMKNVAHCFRCFVKDSMVYTPNGVIPIQDIKVGDTVYSKSGVSKVTKLFKNKYEGDIYNVRLPIPKLKVTAEHPIYVCRVKSGRMDKPHKKNYMWIDAKDLNKDTDFFMVPKSSFKSTLHKLGGVPLNKESGELIGRYLADGHISGTQIQITLGLHKKKYAKKIIEFSKKYFNAKAISYDYPKRGICLVSINYSERMRKWIREYVGVGSTNKRLGSLVRGNKEFLTALIKSYSECDGMIRPVGKTTRTIVNSVSEQLMREIQFALFRIGRMSRYIWQSEKNNPYSKNPKHSLSWCNEKTHYQNSYEDKDYHYFKAKKIEKEHFEGEVYNFETTDNTYLMPFIVHNCNAGLNVAKVIALEKGIINSCSDYLSKDGFLKVLDIAYEDYNLQRPKAPEKTVNPVADIEELKNLVYQQLILKNRNAATELITDYIESKHYLFTTRDDVKSEVWIYQDGIYIPEGRSYVKEMARECLGDAFTTQLLNTIINKIEADTFIDQDVFFNSANENVEEVPIINGIFNLITRKLSPFTPKKVFFNKLPVEYDPKATCPNIDKHFRQVLKNEEDVNVMYELFGFLLYKDYFLEKAFMFVGDGRNGKGKTIELMKRFIGFNNCSSVPLSAMTVDKYRVSEMFGKMANIGGDLSATALKETGLFKELCARDLVGGNRKFKTAINFVNYAKMVFACNELPMVYDSSHGYWNRWMIFEFPYRFEPESIIKEFSEEELKARKIRLMNPEIIDKISTQQELNGLFIKALDGLQGLKGKKEFSKTKGTEEVKQFWIRKANPFQAFAMDHLEEDYDTTISKKKIRKAFNNYRKKHRVKNASDKMIKIVLEEMFGVTDKYTSMGDTFDSEREWFWEGIKFKENSRYNFQDGRFKK